MVEQRKMFQGLVEFFGTLSKEWALEYIIDRLLVNLRENLHIIVQVAKEYCEQLGVDACIKLFERFKAYDGLYFFLGSYLSSRRMLHLCTGDLGQCNASLRCILEFDDWCRSRRCGKRQLWRSFSLETEEDSLCC